ncbi:transmembrane protein 33-containing Krueppel homolog 2 isoform X2 [Rhodnius prolixus]|uniref:Uncharacterized protein n=2 Tax=Rhodnius TaxID=13248 RepID=R4G3U0_RHOPR
MSSNNSTTEGNTPAPGIEALKAHIVLHKTEMFLWCTRLLTIIFTVLYLTPFWSFEGAYYKALLANAATSALRLHQRHPRFILSREFLATVLSEDSFHYIMFSFIFSLVYPFAGALLPIFLFSVIHFASYSLTLLDTLGQNSWWGARLLISLVELQSRIILGLIASVEIVLMPILIILMLMKTASVITPFFYHQFLIMRYKSHRNPYTRIKFRQFRYLFELVANHPQTPWLIRKLILSSISGVCALCPPDTTHAHAQ